MPPADRLEVPRAKVEDYLLDIDHPKGGSKAKFFLARGFGRARPEELADALAAQAIHGWPGDELQVPGRIKHRITGPVLCPDGSAPDILTVWQVDQGSTTAAFITARPHKVKGPRPR